MCETCSGETFFKVGVFHFINQKAEHLVNEFGLKFIFFDVGN